MEIIFIEHALERMKERRISKELVINAIRNPDRVDHGYGGRKVAQKCINGKLLRVYIRRAQG